MEGNKNLLKEVPKIISPNPGRMGFGEYGTIGTKVTCCSEINEVKLFVGPLWHKILIFLFDLGDLGAIWWG